MSTARGALTTGSVAATPPGEAPSAAEEGGKRWMLDYGRLLDGSCVAVAAAVDRCCYADVDVVSVVWGWFRVAPVSLPATSHTHPWCTPSLLRPHEVLATSASAVVPWDGRRWATDRQERERERIDTQWATGTGGEEATTDTQQLSRGTRHPTLATTANERCARPESSSLKSQARAN